MRAFVEMGVTLIETLDTCRRGMKTKFIQEKMKFMEIYTNQNVQLSNYLIFAFEEVGFYMSRISLRISITLNEF